MDVLSFIATVILVTASGSLAPGPLFFAVISHGTKHGAKSGLLSSVGHTLVEFPLVILLAAGLLSAASQPLAKSLTGVIGGTALLVFGALQIRGSIITSRLEQNSPRKTAFQNPLLIGLIFTLFNPFFLVWWLTAGGKLIVDSLMFASLVGVLIMYVSHVWMDYAWLTAIAYLARIGTNILGSKAYKGLMAAFGAILIYFGLTFLFSVLWAA